MPQTAQKMQTDLIPSKIIVSVLKPNDDNKEPSLFQSHNINFYDWEWNVSCKKKVQHAVGHIKKFPTSLFLDG